MRAMIFEIVGKIENIEKIATGPAIRDRKRLRKNYGGVRWRKLKGFARVRLTDGTEHNAGCIGTNHTALAKEKLRSNDFFE